MKKTHKNKKYIFKKIGEILLTLETLLWEREKDWASVKNIYRKKSPKASGLPFPRTTSEPVSMM